MREHTVFQGGVRLQPLMPTATVHLFPGLSAELLTLLRQLSLHEWELPTVCALWSVKDLAAHLLGGNSGPFHFNATAFSVKGQCRS